MSEDVIIDRRVEPETIQRLRKDGGKVRVHCWACLAMAIVNQVTAALVKRYQPIHDKPPALYDRKTKALVKLGEGDDAWKKALHAVTNELLEELDLHWLAKEEGVRDVILKTLSEELPGSAPGAN